MTSTRQTVETANNSKLDTNTKTLGIYKQIRNESHDPTLLIRGLACLAIIWFHLEPPLYSVPYIGKFNYYLLLSNYGGTFVFIFYMLSGYGVGYTFFSHRYRVQIRSIISFYTKRFFRLAPAYYLVIIFCYAFFYRSTVPFNQSDFIRFLTFRGNEFMWTLPFQGVHAIVSTEMQFYLVAPIVFILLAFMFKKIHPLLSGIIIITVTLLVKYYLSTLGYLANPYEYNKYIYARVLGNIDLFVFGMYLSYLKLNHVDLILKIKKYISPITIGILFVIWLSWANWFNEYYSDWANWPTKVFQRYYLLPLTINLLIGWIILSATVNKTFIPIGNFKIQTITKLLVYPKTFLYGLGALSYGMYLWHYPIIFYLFRGPNSLGLISTWPAFFYRLGIVLGITIIISIITYAVIERRFMLLGKTISKYIT